MWLLFRDRLGELGFASSPWFDGELAQRSARSLFVVTAALCAAVFALALALWFTPSGIVVGLAMVALVLCAAFDLSALRVPNALTYSGTALMLLAAALAGGDVLRDAAAGALGAGGFLLAMSLISRGKVGVGDAKLGSLGGALVGIDYAIPALFVGTLSAALVYLALLFLGRISRTDPLPYAPFLSFGFVMAALATGSTLRL